MNDKIKLDILPVGKDYYPTNCYILSDKNKNAIMIDPGFDFDKIMNLVNTNGYKIRYVILTHCHADHLSVLGRILAENNCKAMIHKNDALGIFDDDKAYYTHQGIEMKNDVNIEDLITLNDGDKINVGDISLEVIHTPGHTDGCICLYNFNNNILFTGDTLFHNCYGRCDLKSSSINDMEHSLNKLFERFSDVIIYPGHEESINIDNVKKRIKLLLKMKR